jgi:hypothetical protein
VFYYLHVFESASRRPRVACIDVGLASALRSALIKYIKGSCERMKRGEDRTGSEQRRRKRSIIVDIEYKFSCFILKDV